MTDADLIYNACLRAERKIEEAIVGHPPEMTIVARSAMATIRMLREEIGNGLAAESR